MANEKTLCDLWRYEQAARYLGISPSTLRRKVMERAVPFYRPFGKRGRILFDPADLADFVRAHRVEPLSA